MEAGTGSGTHREVSLKIDNKKRQLLAMRNWRSRIKYDNAGNTAMIMPVEGHNVSGQNSGFF